MKRGERTGNLDFVPELGLVSLRPRLILALDCGFAQLARVHEPLAGQAATIILRYTGRHGAHLRAHCLPGVQPGEPLGPFLLQLLGQLLDGQGFEDVFGGSREEGEDGVGAVCLVLFESTP